MSRRMVDIVILVLFGVSKAKQKKGVGKSASLQAGRLLEIDPFTVGQNRHLACFSQKIP